jgi:hypothetical protein
MRDAMNTCALLLLPTGRGTMISDAIFDQLSILAFVVRV